MDENLYMLNVAMTALFILYWAPDSSPKEPHPCGVIQPKRYIDESFFHQNYYTLKFTKNTNDRNFPLYRGLDISSKGPMSLTDSFSYRDTWIIKLFPLNLLHIGAYKYIDAENCFCLFDFCFVLLCLVSVQGPRQ